MQEMDNNGILSLNAKRMNRQRQVSMASFFFEDRFVP